MARCLICPRKLTSRQVKAGYRMCGPACRVEYTRRTNPWYASHRVLMAKIAGRIEDDPRRDGIFIARG